MVKRKNPNGIPSSIHKRTITEKPMDVPAQDLKDLTKYVNNNTRTYILPRTINFLLEMANYNFIHLI